MYKFATVMLLNLETNRVQLLVTETNNLVSASMPFDSRYFCHHVIIRWQSHRLPVGMDVHVMKELNDNQRQLNMNNNNRWRKMIAQWSVEQEILRTTIYFGVIDEHLILQLVARIMLCLLENRSRLFCWDSHW